METVHVVFLIFLVFCPIRTISLVIHGLTLELTISLNGTNRSMHFCNALNYLKNDLKKCRMSFIHRTLEKRTERLESRDYLDTIESRASIVSTC